MNCANPLNGRHSGLSMTWTVCHSAALTPQHIRIADTITVYFVHPEWSFLLFHGTVPCSTMETMTHTKTKEMRMDEVLAIKITTITYTVILLQTQQEHIYIHNKIPQQIINKTLHLILKLSWTPSQNETNTFTKVCKYSIPPCSMHLM